MLTKLTVAPPGREPGDPELWAEFGGFCADNNARLGRMRTWTRALALLKLQAEHISAIIAMGELPPTREKEAVIITAT